MTYTKRVERAAFLRTFGHEISLPVMPRDELFGYVPTQIVAEYLAGDSPLAELAKALNVSKPTVWAWEQGRAVPTPDRFEKIASVLGTTAAALRTGIDTDAALALVEQSRRRIAEAYSVPVGQVRIMIEL